MADDPFRPLRLEYLEGARARLPELHALADASATDVVALAALRRLAHNLRGSGGFYGFTAITEAAAALEELIIAAEGAPPSAEALVQAATALADVVNGTRLPGA